MKIDLHCHTTCSDGSESPTKILEIAKQENVEALSITDHDSIEAYKEIFPLEKDFPIKIIPGVEFSAEHQGCYVHILGYSFDLSNAKLQAFCELHRKLRFERKDKIIDLLRKKNMPISEQDLLESNFNNIKQVGRPHIARAMLKKGYITTFREAFYKYLGDGKCCYVPTPSFSAEETIAIIRQAGGKAVFAHPMLCKSEIGLQQLLTLDFDGIECNYAYCTPFVKKKWRDIAKKKGWLVTGGSDFHGDLKPNQALGCSTAPKETWEFLYSLYLKNKK